MPHPGASISGEVNTAAPFEAYRLRIVTRCRVGPLRLRPGQELLVDTKHLRCVAFLVRNRTARPLDANTQRDVEVFEALRAAPP